MTAQPSSTGARPEAPRQARPFPAVLRGRRRQLFVRLLGNGVLQAGAALALPFAILASTQLTVVPAAALLGLLTGLLIALRIVAPTSMFGSR